MLGAVGWDQPSAPALKAPTDVACSLPEQRGRGVIQSWPGVLGVADASEGEKERRRMRGGEEKRIRIKGKRWVCRRRKRLEDEDKQWGRG